MLTVRLATAPDPSPMPGLLRVELMGLGDPVSLLMPPAGLATTSQPLPPPPSHGEFKMIIYYYLDKRRVGVIVNGVGENDSIAFISPIVPILIKSSRSSPVLSNFLTL